MTTTLQDIRRRLGQIMSFGPLKVSTTRGSHRRFVIVANSDGDLEANCGVDGERNRPKAEFFANAPDDVTWLLDQLEEWIDVDEEQPENDDIVLVCFAPANDSDPDDTGAVWFGYYDAAGDCWHNPEHLPFSDDVTYWRKLPAGAGRTTKATAGADVDVLLSLRTD